MGDLKVAIVPGGPSDGDEVVWHVEPALRTERDVMQCRFLNVLAADAAAVCVSFEYEVPDVTGDEP